MRGNWKAVKDENGKFKMVKQHTPTETDGTKGTYSDICYNNPMGDEGYFEAGYEEGYNEGYDSGRDEGYDAGWDDGYEKGYEDAVMDVDDDDDEDDDFDPNDVATPNFGEDVTRCARHTLRCDPDGFRCDPDGFRCDPDGFRCDPDGCNGCNEVLVTVTNGNFHTGDGYCHVWSPALKRIVNYKKLEED